MQNTHILAWIVSATLLLHPYHLTAKSKDSSGNSPPASQADLNKLNKKIGDISKKLNEQTYGSWFIIGNPVTLSNQSPLNFNQDPELKSEIVHANGDFKLPRQGVYMVTFGISTKKTASTFELQLSGQPVTGSKLNTSLDAYYAFGSGTLTVMFQAKAGDNLQLVNVSGKTVTIESGEKEAVAAYISILQLR